MFSGFATARQGALSMFVTAKADGQAEATDPGEATDNVMSDHLRDGAAAIHQPFCVYSAQERLVAYNQAFADLHRLPDGGCLLHPGIAFHEIMEWRKQAGFF